MVFVAKATNVLFRKPMNFGKSLLAKCNEAGDFDPNLPVHISWLSFGMIVVVYTEHFFWVDCNGTPRSGD